MSSDEANGTILQTLGDSGPGRDITVSPTRFQTTRVPSFIHFNGYLLSTYCVPGVSAPGI